MASTFSCKCDLKDLTEVHYRASINRKLLVFKLTSHKVICVILFIFTNTIETIFFLSWFKNINFNLQNNEKHFFCSSGYLKYGAHYFIISSHHSLMEITIIK